MSATNQLAQQLSQLVDSLKSTNTLITRLSKLSFQPGSEPLDSSSSVRIELAQDIHDSLKQLEEDLELLKQEAEDLGTAHRRRDSERDRDRARLSAQIVRLDEDLRTSRSHFRRAQLTAKKASETAKQKERELVFASLQNPPSEHTSNGTSTPDLFAGRRKAGQQKQLTKEELELDASSNVTASLRRTHDLLSTELSRSRFAQETFDESTAALAELGEHYNNLDTVLSNSRNLLGTLLRSQKSDTWYLETAFYLLCVTLAWLVFRRLLLGPFVRLPVFLLNWFIWKPLYLFLKVTGVITTTTVAAGSNALARKGTSSRPPLIVQPSAEKGSIPKMPSEGMNSKGVPVGMGGGNAKVGKDPVLEGKMSEAVGKMAEESSEKGLPRRADGTVLEQRGNVPRNPKKKVFDEDAGDGMVAEEVQPQQEASNHTLPQNHPVNSSQRLFNPPVSINPSTPKRNSQPHTMSFTTAKDICSDVELKRLACCYLNSKDLQAVDWDTAAAQYDSNVKPASFKTVTSRVIKKIQASEGGDADEGEKNANGAAKGKGTGGKKRKAVAEEDGGAAKVKKGRGGRKAKAEVETEAEDGEHKGEAAADEDEAPVKAEGESSGDELS
ncbi:Protein transport protein sec20 [Vermiconidia calcicola]|uniref:Protein transport protein sec20 n=1 Tax=Vermiconidia calcicola TaxID=1690605 RepID=A0ACC3NE92_9PEZI|nr:Protein transport protein sec20 [Vermiconidia calcicola]